MTYKLPYRADIDGLRAVAVLAVIASHLPEKFLPSGFLGVDVFFAISGFVVTGSLMGQRRTTLGQLYIGFLARRVKRLLPALFVCVAVTGAVVLATDPFPRHSTQTGIASLFGLANFVLFAFELDYFSPSAVFNAFTHMWSLGVEEQFYVVFPLFAWLFFFRSGTASYRPLAIAMVIGGLVSVTLFVALYNRYQPAAFFLMPARIWELGVGSLVFLASRGIRLPRIRNTLDRLAPWALAGLIGCFFVPEIYAMQATLTAIGFTAILLAASGNSVAGDLLQRKPIVYIGKISYSLYLWHWPIIALGPIVLSSDWRSSLIYVVAMVAAAVASFHLVEQPLRFREWTNRRIKDISLGLSANMFLGALLFLGMVRTDAGSTMLHPPAYVPILHNGKQHIFTCALDGVNRKLSPSTIADCTVPAAPGMPTIWTMGDSHSGHLQGMLFETHERLGVGVHLVETPGWPFPFEPGTRFEPRERVFASISKRFRPGDIVLLSRLYIGRTAPYEALNIRGWLNETAKLADELEQLGMHLVVTGPPPLFPFDDIRECDIGDIDSCGMARDKLAPQVNRILTQIQELAGRKSNLTVLDLFEPNCPDDQTFCRPHNGNNFLYRDKDHFNSLGSRRMAEPLVEVLRSNNLLETAD